MNEKEQGAGRQGNAGKRRGCLLPLALLLLVAVGALIWVRYNFYASLFSPTRLTPPEEKALDAKLELLQEPEPAAPTGGDDALKPYSEEEADRTIRLTERELNGLIAEDEETAQRVAVRLSDDLVTLRIVTPVDEDVPVIGGRTIRLKAGVSLAYRAGSPVVALRGISLGGVPLPNAWLGNLKNVNLVEEFAGDGGFWKVFADGVENMEVKKGHLSITLKE